MALSDDRPARRAAPAALKRTCLAIAFLLVLGLGLGADPRAARADAAYVAQVGQRALSVARGNDPVSAKVADIRTIMSRYSDMQTIALFTLGRYRRKFPETQMIKYLDLLENFVAKFIVSYAKSFAGQRLEIGRIKRRSPTDVVVESRVIYGGGETPSQVKWRVIQVDGEPKIFDIQVRGVWLTLRLRQQFADVLKDNNGKFSALFAYMSR